LTFTGLYSPTSQEVELFIVTAVRTSNPTGKMNNSTVKQCREVQQVKKVALFFPKATTDLYTVPRPIIII
jgi:hypothetical protein